MSDITITTEDFNAGDEINALRLAGVGAIVTFTGIVRDKAEHPDLIAMTLEHFPGMTEQEIQTIVDQARERWPLRAVRVIHRVGRLLPQENIVFVGTASAHRQAAFDSASFIMDYLKTKAPFWKKKKRRQGLHGLKPVMMMTKLWRNGGAEDRRALGLSLIMRKRG